jgi:asparagine N-glycosylation enzyme membrane subunit Stt3
MVFCYAEQPKINFEGKSKYYFCAVFENGGLDFFTSHEIKSSKEFEINKSILEEDFSKYDANYYKIDKEENMTVALGYSILTNELRAIFKIDSKGRLVYEKIFDVRTKTFKECSRVYYVKNEIFFAKVECNDNTSQIIEFTFDPKYKINIRNSITNYKNGKFLNKLKYLNNGKVVIYNRNNSIIDAGNWIPASDTCTPFSIYEK